MIATTARSHRADGVHVRERMRGRRIQRRPAGKGNSFVCGLRKRHVRYVALASQRVARSGPKLRRYLRLAGLR